MGISFDFRKAHVPFLISATVWSGKQHVGSKTKPHTRPFCLSEFFSLFDSILPLTFLSFMFSLFNPH